MVKFVILMLKLLKLLRKHHVWRQHGGGDYVDHPPGQNIGGISPNLL